jgi:hypothetical protein
MIFGVALVLVLTVPQHHSEEVTFVLLLPYERGVSLKPFGRGYVHLSIHGLESFLIVLAAKMAKGMRRNSYVFICTVARL